MSPRDNIEFDNQLKSKANAQLKFNQIAEDSSQEKFEEIITDNSQSLDISVQKDKAKTSSEDTRKMRKDAVELLKNYEK